jgi:hypothetical protein
MHGSEKVVETRHANRCQRFKTKEKQTKPSTPSLYLGLTSVCPCSPRSIIHSLTTQHLGSTTTEYGGVYQHEAADTPSFQLRTNPAVTGPKCTQGSRVSSQKVIRLIDQR